MKRLINSELLFNKKFLIATTTSLLTPQSIGSFYDVNRVMKLL